MDPEMEKNLAEAIKKLMKPRAVIGIDFGSKSVVVTVTMSDDPTKAAIVRNNLSLDSTPNVVAFQGQQRFVGEEANSKESMVPKSTVTCFPEIMGLTHADLVSHDDRYSFLPFQVAASESGEVIMKIEREYCFKDDLVAVEQLAAMMIIKCRAFAEAQIGEPIASAVITVPGAWNSRQQQSLLDAARIAKLHVSMLVPHIEAAIHVYGNRRLAAVEKAEKSIHVVFFDQGYSFMSLAVVRFTGLKGRVLAAASNTFGGGDIDRLLWNHFAAKIKKEHGVTIVKGTKLGLRLMERVEKAKKSLSTIEECSVDVENALGGDRDYKLKLSRNALLEICASHFKTLGETMQSALATAGLTAEDLLSCEVIGGNSRSPMIQKCLKRVVGDKIGFLLDSASAAAEGAGMIAAVRQAQQLEGLAPVGSKSGAAEDKSGKAETFILEEGSLLAALATGVFAASAGPGLSDASIAAAIAQESEWTEKDSMLKKVADAKNALEAYVYDMRSKMYDSPLLPEAVVKPLVDAEEEFMWSETAATAGAEEFTSHLTVLQGRLEAECPDYFKSVAEDRGRVEAQLIEEAKKAEEERAAGGGDEEDHDFRKLKFPDRLRILLKNKDEGTELFKDGNFAHAHTRYVRALAHCEKFKDLSPEQKKEVNDVKLSLHLNIAMCSLKLENYENVIHNCTAALELHPESTKALYRRASALYYLKKYEEAVKDLTLCQKLDPEDKAVKKVMDAALLGIKKEQEKQKSMAKKMFG